MLGLVLLRLDSDTDSGNLLVPWLASSAQSRESGLRNTGNVGTFFPGSLGGVASVMGPSPSLHRNWNQSSLKNGGWVKGGGQLPVTLSPIFMFSLGTLL